MPKLTRIYTRTGDDRMTAIGTRERVAKNSLRVQAIGEVDELNSTIGVAISSGLNHRVEKALTVIQHELFVLGADLAYPPSGESSSSTPRIKPEHVKVLENLIDAMLEDVGTLENFILPGGSIGSANLHVARTVCRRAERSIVHLSREEPVNSTSLTYLNRLSDALFVMARYENRDKDVDEPLWDSHS